VARHCFGARADLILPKLERLSDGSYLTKIYPSSRARARDDDGIPARLITYHIGKKREEYRLLCSILDSRRAPGVQLANLYTKRWTIETVLDELKTRLRGARVVLRSRTPNLTRQDLRGCSWPTSAFEPSCTKQRSSRRSKQPIYRLFVPYGRSLGTYFCTFLFPPRQKKKLFKSLLHELARSDFAIARTVILRGQSNAR
jgi:hypothetical protein